MRPAITRIETTVQTGLGEEVELRARLRIEEQHEARIEKFLFVGVDETIRRRLETVSLQLKRAAQPRPDSVVSRRPCECLIDPIDEVVNRSASPPAATRQQR